jgi:hypothetical protein
MQKYGKITGWWVYCVLCFGVATVLKKALRYLCFLTTKQ